MTRDRYARRNCHVIGAALALAASTALAEAPAPQQVADASTDRIVVDSTASMPQPSRSRAQFIYPSSEARLRRAAAEGMTALHLYIYRTRMIYNYYIWDFVDKEDKSS